MEQSQFTLVNEILYRVLPDGALHLIQPTLYHYTLFLEAHAGKFGGIFENTKSTDNSVVGTGGEECVVKWLGGVMAVMSAHLVEWAERCGYHWYPYLWKERLIEWRWMSSSLQVKLCELICM